jgi:hypothetical protein
MWRKARAGYLFLITSLVTAAAAITITGCGNDRSRKLAEASAPHPDFNPPRILDPGMRFVMFSAVDYSADTPSAPTPPFENQDH